MADSTGAASSAPEFLFATCQVGAEAALKSELARRWPEFNFAYSRPGFVTFKLPAGHTLQDDFDLGSIFARSHGFALGRTSYASEAARAGEVWKIAGDRPFDILHVWQRDTAAVGFRGFEPAITPTARAAEAAILAAAPGETTVPQTGFAKVGRRVLDCIVVEPELWWIGEHRARQDESRFAGGIRSLEQPADAVSRAWLKMEEGLAWSELPVERGQRIVEIGCAPGGASQALLDRGLTVIGIDPARVDPRVLEHPRFTHLRKRGADVRRREFRNMHWLAADMNVAPEYTLDTVEAIVTHESVNIRGLLLTLKLLDWNLAEQIPDYLARIRSWGFSRVRARQLAHNRQEICVAALRRKSSAKK